ncbi:hypothetical protein PV326_001550, partial [Microctonus aethiopoides]
MKAFSKNFIAFILGFPDPLGSVRMSSRDPFVLENCLKTSKLAKICRSIARRSSHDLPAVQHQHYFLDLYFLRFQPKVQPHSLQKLVYYSTNDLSQDTSAQENLSKTVVLWYGGRDLMNLGLTCIRELVRNRLIILLKKRRIMVRKSFEDLIDCTRESYTNYYCLGTSYYSMNELLGLSGIRKPCKTLYNSTNELPGLSGSGEPYEKKRSKTVRKNIEDLVAIEEEKNVKAL